MLPGKHLHLYAVDSKHSSVLRKHLVARGYQLTLFHSIGGLQDLLDQEQPDLLIWATPHGSSSSAKQLEYLVARHPLLRCLILLDSTSYVDRSLWLNAGADAVLSCPYAIEELQAWINALLRRTLAPSTQHPSITYADLSVDLVRRHTLRAGVQIKLTVKEFDLLVYFLRHPDQVLPRLQILHAVWGASWSGDDNLLDVYIRYLRKKIDLPGLTPLIHTERGIGFVLRQD